MTITVKQLKRMKLGDTVTVGSDYPITYHKSGYNLFIPLNSKFSQIESWTARNKFFGKTTMNGILNDA